MSSVFAYIQCTYAQAEILYLNYESKEHNVISYKAFAFEPAVGELDKWEVFLFSP